jgi:hypothetical protein
MHIIAPNLQRIINLLKRHKFPSGRTFTSAFQFTPCIIDIAQKLPQHVLICIVDLSMKIVFHFNFLLDALVFVCDCCRKFLLPFVAVSLSSCTLNKNYKALTGRKTTFLKGFLSCTWLAFDVEDYSASKRLTKVYKKHYEVALCIHVIMFFLPS